MPKRMLKTIADRQYGYFTSKQAEKVGYFKYNHHYHVVQGNWLHVDRGIYRLPGYDDTVESECLRWSFWAIGRSPKRRVVVSHNSALYLYRLSSESPVTVHLTVSEKQTTKEEKSGCVFHRQELQEGEIAPGTGYLLTTPVRTLLDMKPVLLLEARWAGTVRQGQEQGLITPSEAEALLGKPLYAQTTMLAAERKMSALFATPSMADPAFSTGMTIGQKGKPMGSGQPVRGMSERGRWHGASRSFTLVEMLVVIAIIGILASLLMPSLQRAVGLSRQVSCSNNLHGIFVAESNYAADHRFYTAGRILTGESYNQNLWDHKLRPYLGNREVPTNWTTACALRRIPELWCADTESGGIDTVSYAINGFGYLYTGYNLRPAQPAEAADASNTSLSFLVAPSARCTGIGPSRILFFSELGCTTVSSTGYVHYCIRNGTYFEGSDGGTAPAFRHQSFKNALMLDGHLEAVTYGDMTWQMYLK